MSTKSLMSLFFPRDYFSIVDFVSLNLRFEHKLESVNYTFLPPY